MDDLLISVVHHLGPSLFTATQARRDASAGQKAGKLLLLQVEVVTVNAGGTRGVDLPPWRWRVGHERGRTRPPAMLNALAGFSSTATNRRDPRQPGRPGSPRPNAKAPVAARAQGPPGPARGRRPRAGRAPRGRPSP